MPLILFYAFFYEIIPTDYTFFIVYFNAIMQNLIKYTNWP
jgi:hypothetical protein